MSKYTLFSCKEFSISHTHCAMKVGTDAMVLGSLAGNLALESPQNILDVGTGSGILALMMAQSFPESKVTGLEIEHICAQEAKENAQNSPYSSRVDIVQGSFQNFSENQDIKAFNFILSNPPYFVDSLPPPGADRSTARHHHSLRYEELIIGVSKLLIEGGKFMCILPTEAESSMVSKAQKHQLLPQLITTIYHRDKVLSKRKVFLFEKKAGHTPQQNNEIPPQKVNHKELVLFEQDTNGKQKRTQAYNRISHKFYLH